ncbi:hypothetical protein, partial [Enterococcus sp.]|uniref:hypothetical protein n=1 Tax=Enterococcus sp. TaxID=35783 RepID=UPI002845A77A
MSSLLKRLKIERIQGSSAVLNYSNFDYWVNWDDIVAIVEDYDQPQLNENQQIVLEWLKANVDQDNASPMCSIFLLGSLWESRKFNIQEDIAIDNAYSELSYKQQAQVLEVF